MKRITWILLFLIYVTVPRAQDLKFTDANEYGNWMMSYYKNPQPANLFEAFKYGVNSTEIANSGSRDLVLSFFAAIFRQDTLVQNDFYDRLKTEENQNVRYGFIFSLWYTNGEHSNSKLKDFKQLKINEKDVENIDSLLKTRPIDIFNDPISDPTHLDMCWADYFATGRKQGVLKIISGLENINSQDYTKKVIASSARWSLRNNAYMHETVYEIITEQIENGAPNNAAQLISILKEVDEKRNEHN